jgi:hypothetical protein
MKTLIALTALLLATSAQAKAHHPLISVCANNEYDVTVTLDTTTVKKLGKDIVIVDIEDFSGHGKTYTAVLPQGAWASKLGAGLKAISTEDNGSITIANGGKVAEITGEFNLKLQCLDYTSDNPSGL